MEATVEVGMVAGEWSRMDLVAVVVEVLAVTEVDGEAEVEGLARRVCQVVTGGEVRGYPKDLVHSAGAETAVDRTERAR